MAYDPIPFEKIYNEYKVLVYNVVLQYLQNMEDAQEVTQDVFIQVQQSLDQFQNKATLKTWIYKIAINKSLDHLKYKSRKKRFFIFGAKSDTEKEIQNTSNFEHPGVLLEDQENAAILFSAINELNDAQKTAFLLSKLDGLGNAEIAAIMEVSISAVTSHLFRAKKILREKLEKKFENFRKK